LAIVGHATSNEVSSDQGTQVVAKSFSCTLQPLAPGQATIGATTLTYFPTCDASSPPRTLTTGAITISVLPARPDGKGGFALLIAVVMVVAAGLALSLVLVFRRRRASALSPEGGPSVASAEDQALADLDEASSLRVAGELKAYYVEIAHILTRYLESRWSIQCTGVATYDVVQRMRQQGQLPDSIIQETESILSKCDLVKFAGYDPTPPELDRVHDRAAAFIRQFAALAKEGRAL
jgi:hypothetical protein